MSLNKVMSKVTLPEIIFNIATFLDYTDATNLFNVFDTIYFYSKEKLLSELKIKHLIHHNQNHITKTYSSFSGTVPEKAEIVNVVNVQLNSNSIYYFQPDTHGLSNLRIISNNNHIISLHLKAGMTILDTYIPIIQKEYPFDCLNKKVLPFVLYNGLWLELESNGPVYLTFEYCNIKDYQDNDTYEWWITTNRYSSTLQLPITSLTIVFSTQENFVKIIQKNVAYDLNKITDFVWSLEFPQPIYISYINVICSSQTQNYQIIVNEVNLMLIFNGMIGTRYTNYL